MIRRPNGVVVKSVLGRRDYRCHYFHTTLGRTIFRRFRGHNSGSAQGQIELYVCPENPTGAWSNVKLSLGRRCGSCAQDYRQILRDFHPDVPEADEKGFIACDHIRYRLYEKYGCPVIYGLFSELRGSGGGTHSIHLECCRKRCMRTAHP